MNIQADPIDSPPNCLHFRDGDLSEEFLDKMDSVNEMPAVDLLFMMNVCIGDVEALEFADRLSENTAFKGAVLCQMQISQKSLAKVIDSLLINRKIQVFSLYGTPVLRRVARAISKVLEVSQTLVELDLVASELTSKTLSTLVKGLCRNKTIKSLSLKSNLLDSEGVVWVAKLIRENCFIEKLDLSMCQLGDIGALEIATALKLNRSLRVLNLERNEIGEEGRVCLLDALNENPSTVELKL